MLFLKCDHVVETTPQHWDVSQLAIELQVDLCALLVEEMTQFLSNIFEPEGLLRYLFWVEWYGEKFELHWSDWMSALLHVNHVVL